MEKFRPTSLKDRIPAFDILRVFLLILVVNLHRENMTQASQLFPDRFSWYAVPIFIILSFYLMSKFFIGETLTSSTLVKRVKRFFIPFVFWSFVGFLVSPNAFSMRNITMQFLTGGVVNVPLYYLLIMSIFTIFFGLLTRFSLTHRILALLLLTIGMFYLQYSGVNHTFFTSVEPAIMYCYGRFAELFPYASTGILIGLLTSRKTNEGIFMLGTALFGGLYLATREFKQPEGIDYSGLLFYFGAVFIFMYFFLLRSFRLSEKMERHITTLGLYSFGVYASHYLLLELLLRYVPGSWEFNESYPVGFLLLLVVVSYGTVIGLDKLTRGYFSYLFK